MIDFDVVNFSECPSQEVISSFWRSGWECVQGRTKECNWALYIYIQGGPENKPGTAYFPQYVDAIAGTSVYEVTSPEKHNTKISNFGSVVCFLVHILWGNVEAQKFPFSA